MNLRIWVMLALLMGTTAQANQDLLVKFKQDSALQRFSTFATMSGSKVESLGIPNWVRVEVKGDLNNYINPQTLALQPDIEYVQPNYKVHLLQNYKVQEAALRARLEAAAPPGFGGAAPQDNPAIPGASRGGTGADPLLNKQWGVVDIGAPKGWTHPRSNSVIVAVIDTGVDYTHEDLVNNMWRNAGEMGLDAQGRDKSSNGVDDDANGFVDDLVGWDFVSKDNKPYDLAVTDPFSLLLGGGNPGHGTHCAGNVGAVGNNGIGVSGVMPNAQIMALRFISEKGQGTTKDAIGAITYAVKMGAKVTSNSWGSEGEDPNEGTENKALRDAITFAEQNGVLFIAAAGNGHSGAGYDNDRDAKPAYPASYPHANIISVAAIDSSNQLGSFSNWGVVGVDMGAPGVRVFSTTVANNYSDTVVKLESFGIDIGWDGTSMATPHVAGAAALYWSKNPGATWQQVKEALMTSATPISALQGKVVSNGKLNVEKLMSR